jgi:hypothetical protein
LKLGFHLIFVKSVLEFEILDEKIEKYFGEKQKRKEKAKERQKQPCR